MTETPVPAPRRSLSVEDVTSEYLTAAAPGQGTVTYEEGYRVSGHRAEVDMANWLHRTFGGEIRLLKESNVKNQETPDFIWNLKMWELKGASSVNGADKLLQHAIKQIQDNPGGVILNIGENIDMGRLEQQLMRRVLRSNIAAFDMIVLVKSELVKILRYKK